MQPFESKRQILFARPVEKPRHIAHLERSLSLRLASLRWVSLRVRGDEAASQTMVPAASVSIPGNKQAER
jgi:hypothetical protein